MRTFFCWEEMPWLYFLITEIPTYSTRMFTTTNYLLRLTYRPLYILYYIHLSAVYYTYKDTACDRDLCAYLHLHAYDKYSVWLFHSWWTALTSWMRKSCAAKSAWPSRGSVPTGGGRLIPWSKSCTAAVGLFSSFHRSFLVFCWFPWISHMSWGAWVVTSWRNSNGRSFAESWRRPRSCIPTPWLGMSAESMDHEDPWRMCSNGVLRVFSWQCCGLRHLANFSCPGDQALLQHEGKLEPRSLSPRGRLVLGRIRWSFGQRQGRRAR